MECTLVLAKPDAVQRGHVGNIISRLEIRGLKLIGIKLIKIDRNTAEKHYNDHKAKPFFKGLVEFITSSPVVAMVFEGKNAIEVVRQTMGPTDPKKAPPGTIRGDLGIDMGRNLIHGSDSIESAEKEINIFFDESELCVYDRSIDPWLTES